MEDLADIFERITGLRFADVTLMRRAFIHDSVGAEGRDFERMEFLGDACLAMAVAALLVRRTELSEGGMSQIRSELTRRETLAELLRGWGVERHFVLGYGVNRQRLPDSIYADFFESLVGALYLDQGAAAVEALVDRIFTPLFQELLRRGEDVMNAKGRLQEYFMARGKSPPEYQIVAKRGPAHAPEFTVEAVLPEGGRVRATGPSIKAAEMAAARKALEQLTP